LKKITSQVSGNWFAGFRHFSWLQGPIFQPSADKINATKSNGQLLNMAPGGIL